MKFLKIALVPLLIIAFIALKEYENSLNEEVVNLERKKITNIGKTKNKKITDKKNKPNTEEKEVVKTIKEDSSKNNNKKLISEVKLESKTIEAKQPELKKETFPNLNDKSNFIEALNILNEKSDIKKRVDNTGNFGLNNPTVSRNDAEEEPTPSSEPIRKFAFGQARGYAMLYAMHPKARLVVEKQVKNLLDAKIREIYISVLVDGTFGKDYSYLKNIISRLNTKETTLTLALYVSNGPTMRNYLSTPIDTDFAKIEPSRFREMIKWDDNIRYSYKNLVKEANDIFKYNKRLNSKNTNIIIPMLEDNLMRDSYFVMREIVNKELLSGTKIIRNPCLGCYSGNDADRLGDNIEEHSLERFNALTQGDGFTFDGRGFNYPEEKIQGAFSVKQTESILNIGLQRGFSYIGLWHPKWQGLLNSNVDVHPDDRVYALPTTEELEYEIELLREGLSIESEIP